MAGVTKSASPTGHGNTLVTRPIKIYFQVYPGVAGPDDLRGIPGVRYWVWIAKQGYGYSGTTEADGSIELNMTSGSELTITIFDTEYEIAAVEAPQPIIPNFTPGADLYKGIQRRLQLLGYYFGQVNGGSAETTREALLNFQADSSLNADHVSSESTINQLIKDLTV